MHADNDSFQNTAAVGRFRYYLEQFDERLDYIAKRCRIWNVPFDPEAARRRDLRRAESLIAATRLAEGEGVPAAVMLLGQSLQACMASAFSLRHRMALAVWLVLVAAGPRPLASRLIEMRFVVQRRPHWMERVLGHRKAAEMKVA